MMIILEIACGVIIGLAAFNWLRKAYRDWDNRRANRSLEKVKEVIMRGMPPMPPKK